MDEDYGSSVVPDSTTPIVGYRAWLVNDGLLHSIYPLVRPVPWPVGEVLKAKCFRTSTAYFVMHSCESHISPCMECVCGIYGLHRLIHERRKRPWPADCLEGLVEVWGRIIIGSLGFRAQYARPIALFKPRSVRLLYAASSMASLYGLELISRKQGREMLYDRNPWSQGRG